MAVTDDISWRPEGGRGWAGLGFSEDGRPRVLLVDDDPAVLRSVGRLLSHGFDVVCESRSENALGVLESKGPFAVILSDLKMPGLDGIELLQHCRFAAPEAPRLLLTGNADLESAMGAVNTGRVSGYLTKPVDSVHLRRVLNEAAEQHERFVAERAAISGTIEGAVDALFETLRIGNPPAYRVAHRVHELVGRYLDRYPVPVAWPVELASKLSQLGSLALGPDLTAQLASRDRLSGSEALLARSAPAFTVDLIDRIPRMEAVSVILRNQQRDYDGAAPGPTGSEIPFGSRLLRIVTDLAQLELRRLPHRRIATEMGRRTGAYDERLLERVLMIHAAEESATIDLTSGNAAHFGVSPSAN